MTTSKSSEALLEPIEDAFKAIGYRASLIRKNYTYSDFIAQKPVTRTIDLAIFGQDPPDYRSACFGVAILAHQLPTQSILPSLRPLGAPGIFIIKNGKSEWWVNREAHLTLQEELHTRDLTKLIRSNSQDWNPERVIRIKSGLEKPKPQQLDFIDIGLLPALEHQASTKIDNLIGRVVYDAKNYLHESGLPLDDPTLFKVLFGLLTAKILKDHGVPTSSPINLSDPLTSLEAVSNYYGEPKDRYPATLLHTDLINRAASEIRDAFSLKNLSIDTLAYIYENTFVSRESRQKWGIHSTPSYIADYVMAQLPFEDIPREKWNVFDPMCGHGIFLIAAMRRMRNLLPAAWGGRQRHRFFTERLHGTDIDSFSIEVAKLCLTMADFPQPDGWDLRTRDIFKGETLETEAKSSTVIVGNPPFEALKEREHETPKPKELLRRILPALSAGSLFGFVLPQSFLDANDYKKERLLFSRFFQILSVTTLPDRLFRYSGAETVLLVAKKGKDISGSGWTTYRHVTETGRSAFRQRLQPAFEDIVPASYFEERRGFTLFVPLFREIWERLRTNPHMKDVADIKTGVQYEPNKSKEDFVGNSQFPESTPGIFETTGGFKQYTLDGHVYMSVNKAYRRKAVPGAWELNWHEPKVIIPKSRTSRGPWHFAAAIDRNGLLVSRRFFAVWPKQAGISVECLAALFNSPVGQLFVFSHSLQRDIAKRIYDSIPIPKDLANLNAAITEFVNHYVRAVDLKNVDIAQKTLIKIDMCILQSYDLPRRLQRRILELYSTHERPVSHCFDGYKIQEMLRPRTAVDLLARELSPEAKEFCMRRRIGDNGLRKALKVIQQSFPGIVGFNIAPENDPDTEEEWLLIDITVDSDPDEIQKYYDKYISNFVNQVPSNIQNYIRLSFDLM